MSNLFPIGLAAGEGFCNRVKERELLANNIKNTRHTVLISPRRYGKTSLVTEVIKSLDYPHCEMDFLLCGNPDAAQAIILEKVGQLLYKILPKTSQLKKHMLNIFGKFRPEISLTYHEVEMGVKLHKDKNQSSDATTISDVLENLDKAAMLAKKRVVIFMDEFQQIGLLGDQHVIEAAIRHAAERSKWVSYVFSGSNRHLLFQMFSDKKRPFYRLCDNFVIKRISESEHILFIQKHAKSKWKKILDDDTMKIILRLSESHSYYINLICNYFWSNNIFPTADKVESIWKKYVQNQRAIFSSDIADLSNNQKTVLKYFATHLIDQPYSKEVWLNTQLTPASLKQAITKLISIDILFIDDNGYVRVLDPAMKTFICNDT